MIALHGFIDQQPCAKYLFISTKNFLTIKITSCSCTSFYVICYSDGTISSTGHSQISPQPSSELSQTSIQLTSPSGSSKPISITDTSVSPSTTPAEVHKTRLAPTLLDHTNTATPNIAVPHRITKGTPTSQPTNPNGQSLVMLHVSKSGEAYLVPANRVIAQSDNNKVLPVKLSTTAMSAAPTAHPAVVNGNISSMIPDNDAIIEQSLVAPPAPSVTNNAQSSLTIAKMVSAYHC